MILYFSGTGNSAYTAQKIAENIQDDTHDLFQKSVTAITPRFVQINHGSSYHQLTHGGFHVFFRIGLPKQS